jgi:hypothetical protein
MKEKFLQLADSLNENESDNIVILLTHLLEAWEDDKIDLSTTIQDFELSTIYKVLNLFTNEREDSTTSSDS